MTTRLVLLGTGNPNYDPGVAQACAAVVVDERAYIVDCGDGAMLRLSEMAGGLSPDGTTAAAPGMEALAPARLTHLFLTHLHPDHTAGLPGFIIGPWVLFRTAPLHIYGPPGTQALVGGIVAAYERGIGEHRDGIAPIDHPLLVEVREYTAGEIYRDDLVRVTAFPVVHGTLAAFGFRFETPDKTVVFSGDTAPTQALVEAARGADILVHEAYYSGGLGGRSPAWQAYHTAAHTSGRQLAAIAAEARPSKLVLTHQMVWGDHAPDDLLAEIRAGYDGEVLWGEDGLVVW